MKLRTGTLLVLALALMAFTAMSTNVPMLRLQSQLVIFSGLALLYCFLFHPMALVFRNSRWAKMMDWGLAGTSLLVTLYLVFQFESPGPRVHQGMALLGLLLLLEGSRRATGMALPFLVFLFGFYGFFGSLLPGFLLPHRGFSEERLLAQCFLPGQGIFGMALEVTFHEAFLLVAFGVLLAQLGGPRFVLQELERRFRGQTGAAEKVALLCGSSAIVLGHHGRGRALLAQARVVPHTRRAIERRRHASRIAGRGMPKTKLNTGGRASSNASTCCSKLG